MEIIRELQNNPSFNRNSIDIKRIKNDIRSLSSKLSRLEKKIKDA